MVVADTPRTVAARAVEALFDWTATGPAPDAQTAYEALCAADPTWANPVMAWRLAPTLIAEARRRKVETDADVSAGAAPRACAVSAADTYFIAIRLYAGFRRAAVIGVRADDPDRRWCA